jgi:hypothetical protein
VCRQLPAPQEAQPKARPPLLHQQAAHTKARAPRKAQADAAPAATSSAAVEASSSLSLGKAGPADPSREPPPTFRPLLAGSPEQQPQQPQPQQQPLADLLGQPLTEARLHQLLKHEAVEATTQAALTASQLIEEELAAAASRQEALEALLAAGQPSSELLDVAAAQQQADGWDPDPGVLLQHDELAAPPPASRQHPGQPHGPTQGEVAAWEAFHQLPPLGEQPEGTQQQLEGIRERIKRICSQPGECELPQGWGESDWQCWLQELSALLPDPDAFQAHSLRKHYPAWAEFLGDRNRASSRAVLRQLREGIKFEWQHPRSEQQQRHPRWRQNLERIERAITMVYGPQEVARFLDASQPQPIHLPNHQSISSTQQHADFTREQISKLEQTGAAKRWPFKHPPRVVLPLGVATNAAGKLRLVLDGGYVNLWAGKSASQAGCASISHV